MEAVEQPKKRQKIRKCFLRRVTSVIFSKFRCWCRKKKRAPPFFEAAHRAVLMNKLVRMNSGPKISEKLFSSLLLVCLLHYRIMSVMTWLSPPSHPPQFPLLTKSDMHLMCAAACAAVRAAMCNAACLWQLQLLQNWLMFYYINDLLIDSVPWKITPCVCMCRSVTRKRYKALMKYSLLLQHSLLVLQCRALLRVFSLLQPSFDAM